MGKYNMVNFKFQLEHYLAIFKKKNEKLDRGGKRSLCKVKFKFKIKVFPVENKGKNISSPLFIIHLMDMSLSKLWGIMKDREACLTLELQRDGHDSDRTTTTFFLKHLH